MYHNRFCTHNRRNFQRAAELVGQLSVGFEVLGCVVIVGGRKGCVRLVAGNAAVVGNLPQLLCLCNIVGTVEFVVVGLHTEQGKIEAVKARVTDQRDCLCKGRQIGGKACVGGDFHNGAPFFDFGDSIAHFSAFCNGKPIYFFHLLMLFLRLLRQKMRKPLQTKKNNLDKTMKDTYNRNIGRNNTKRGVLWESKR